MRASDNRLRVGQCRLLGVVVFLLATVLFTNRAAAGDKMLNVVTTIPDLAAVAQEVGKGHVEASAIGTGHQNPHFIDAKPSFMMKAHKADLWIRVGLQLEAGYEPLILQGARNGKILVGQPGHLDASAGIKALEVPSNQIGASTGLTMGDVHPGGNPHYWLDPYNIRIVARTIAERLKQLDPPHAGDYDANLKDFLQRVDAASFGPALVAAVGGDKLWAMQTGGELDAYLKNHPSPALGGWFGQLQPLKGMKVVTYHKSWTYFAERFGLEMAGEVEPKPGIPPSPGHVADLIEKMKSEGVKIILMEPYYERDAPNKIARDAGATVVVAAFSVGGQPEARDYLSLIDNMVGRLVMAARQQGLLKGGGAASSTIKG